MSGLDVFGELALSILIAGVAGAVTFLVVQKILDHLNCTSFDVVTMARDSRVRMTQIADAFFVAVVLAYVIGFSCLMVLKHQAFHTGYDFAISDQVIWNTLHGRILETSIAGPGSTWLGTHFAPILVALVPLYSLWDDPRTLLIFQTIALGFAAFPLYWLARKWLGGFLAVTLVVAFFLFPALEWVNLAEFHEIALAIPLLSFATYFLIRRSYLPFLVSFFLSLLLREEVAFIGIAFGLFLLLQGQRKLGLFLVLAGFGLAIAFLQYVIPFFAGITNDYVVGLHYAAFGDTPSEVVSSILSRPDLVLRTLFVTGKAAFVLQLLVPLVFLSLVGLEISLLALPTFGYLLLAGDAQSSIYFQYTAPIIPFLFFGSIVGLQRILNSGKLRQIGKWITESSVFTNTAAKISLAVLVLVSSLASYYFFAPGPLARSFAPAAYQPDTHRVEVTRSLLNDIPNNAALLTRGTLTPHLTHRTRIYYYPFIDDYRRPEYILIDMTECGWCTKEGLDPILSSGYYQTLLDSEGFFLAKRRSIEHPLQIRFADQVTLLGYTIVTTDTLRGGQTLRPIVNWRADKEIVQRYVIEARIVDNEGHVWAEDVNEPQGGHYPTNRWTVGEIVGDQYALQLPSTMPPGDYQFRLAVRDPESKNLVDAHDATGQQLESDVVLASVRIEKDHSSITASQLRERFQLEQPFYVDMGEIRLLGFTSMPRTVAAGQTLPVGLYWRARGKPQGDYSVVVQLRDASGRVAFEQESRPANGAYPTTDWAQGEVLLDWHDLELPSSLSTGDYTIHVLLRQPVNGAILGDTALQPVSIRARE